MTDDPIAAAQRVIIVLQLFSINVMLFLIYLKM